jgi:hypothetical protein
MCAEASVTSVLANQLRSPAGRSEAVMLEESGRRIGASDVIPTFPTLVWKVELNTQLSESINAKALAIRPELSGHRWCNSRPRTPIRSS